MIIFPKHFNDTMTYIIAFLYIEYENASKSCDFTPSNSS